MSQTAKIWTKVKEFDGLPKISDFKCVEEQIPLTCKPGEIVVEALYLTVDPYMRGFPLPLKSCMPGQQIGRVKVSNNKNFPEGCIVLCTLGWRSLTLVSEPESVARMFGSTVTKLGDFGGLPVSLGLGILGMPGWTAYFGLLHRGKPKAGETVLVSGAAGAVGSAVGQIAKIKGCTVIGSAGTNEKCKWLKDLGFDHVFNYKEKSVDEALKEMAPKGVDVYFDNVGGDYSYAVLTNHMNFGGRQVVCGAISQYNNTDPTVKSTARSIIYKQLDVLGIIVSAWVKQFPEASADLLQWVKEGKLKYEETVTEGFNKMPDTFISLFHGANTGKALVKV